ncbi:hypothetical protein B0H10DRAFT_2201677 [Mycena sp. CBHHK59/15]|nr:hypothetical protein B0H10DRAFT_2201677 [Mycena sp. CBHHK59/15]
MSHPPVIPALDSTLGAIEVGGVVSTYLFGIETLQAYYYFRKFPADSVWLKVMVAAVWLFELGHTIAVWHAIYCVTVTFYGQPQHLQDPPLSLEMTIFFSLMINAAVQIFFTNRVRVLSGKWMIPVACWALAIFRAICNFVVLGLQWKNRDLSAMQTKFKWLMTTGLAVGLTVDIVVTLAMCYWLRKMSSTKFSRTKDIADALLVWAVESGVATSTASAMLLILVMYRHPLRTPCSSLFKPPVSDPARCLNGRQRFRSTAHLEQVNLSTMPKTGTVGQFATERSRGMVIEMSRMTETDANTLSKDVEGGRYPMN